MAHLWGGDLCYQLERDHGTADTVLKRDNKRPRLFMKEYIYQSKTKELQLTYQVLLTVIQRCLGNQEEDVLWNAALGVFSVIKDDKITNQSDKKKEIENLLRVMISNNTFNQLVSNCRLIMDLEEDVSYDDEELEESDEEDARKLLDLETLAFDHLDLPMVGEKLDVPDGTNVHLRAGYVDVNIPPLMPKQQLDCSEELVKIGAMPDWAQPAFKGMTQLNRVQSKVYETALFTTENILLCAPPGVGERDVAILTILQQIASKRNPDGSFKTSGYSIVYVAQTEACVAQVVRSLSSRLQHYNVQVKELSWDSTLNSQQVQEAQVIVTTPQKWDIVSRKSGDQAYAQLVKLLIIDQIDLLHDSRGPALESIIARTVRQMENSEEDLRLVGLSVALFNYEDLALFLRVDREKGLFYFDNSYKPCSLSQQYIGTTVWKPLKRFQLMNDLCYEKVMAVSGKHPVLIFVHSMNETSRTAREIRDTALATSDNLGCFFKEDSASREVLRDHAELVESNDLKDLLPHGFAIHHAGMAMEDCKLVEDLFSQGHIGVLVCTVSFAWGVKLSALTVIIKGTKYYDPNRGLWSELSPLDVSQMLGCAGGPQHNSYGEGLVLTLNNELLYYLLLMNHQYPIESRFVSELPYQLNAEIVLGTVQNVREAIDWIGHTFLYIRMLQKPLFYGLSPEDLIRDKLLDERKADLIHAAVTMLDKNNLVKFDRKSGNFQVTERGRLLATSTYHEGLNPIEGDIEQYPLVSLSEIFEYSSKEKELNAAAERHARLSAFMSGPPRGGDGSTLWG